MNPQAEEIHPIARRIGAFYPVVFASTIVSADRDSPAETMAGYAREGSPSGQGNFTPLLLVYNFVSR
jgi:hypothetical protein